MSFRFDKAVKFACIIIHYIRSLRLDEGKLTIQLMGNADRRPKE